MWIHELSRLTFDLDCMRRQRRTSTAAVVDSRTENGHRKSGIPAFGVTELSESKSGEWDKMQRMMAERERIKEGQRTKASKREIYDSFNEATSHRI